MSATDELRRMLGERGVKWWPLDGTPDMTECIVDGVRHKYRPVGGGIIWSSCTEVAVKPAQAIAATLGNDGAAELQAENAKLRDERNHWKVEQTHAYSNWEDAHKRVVDIEAENTKLRELVRDMWPFVKAGSVHTCPNRECCLFEECVAGSERECPIEEHMVARMRELKIEVDG